MVDKSLTSTNLTHIPHTFRSYTQSCAQSYTQSYTKKAARKSGLLSNHDLSHRFNEQASSDRCGSLRP